MFTLSSWSTQELGGDGAATSLLLRAAAVFIPHMPFLIAPARYGCRDRF